MHIFLQFFGWPNGGVWSNVAAEPIIVILTAAAVVLGRKPLGKKVAAWRAAHHQHIKDHITNEINQLREELGVKKTGDQ